MNKKMLLNSRLLLKHIPLINFMALLVFTICAMKDVVSEDVFTLINFVIGTGVLSNIFYIYNSNEYNISLKNFFKSFKELLKSVNIISSVGILFILTTNLLHNLNILNDYSKYLNILILIESFIFGLLVIIGFCIKSKEYDINNKK